MQKQIIMSHKLLLPNRFKIIGWFLLIPSTILGIILSFYGFDAHWLNATVFAILNNEILGGDQFFAFIHTDITNTVAGAVFIIGAMFVGFSREKKEDEYISNLRLSSLLWAVYVSYILLLVAFLFIYGTGFFTVMVYNMFTILIIFIVRFNYILYKNFKKTSDEK